ncbi:hypothetical protein K1719_022634 [Acacia pycnantha]|nr:hypothetical protein K1719_022634 [Acacia pycnantha]
MKFVLKVMDKSSSLRSSSADGGLFSCWGCLKLKLPWSKRHSYKPAGGFRYDPLSYAQNFDDGCLDGDEEKTRRGFSARYAASSTNKSSGYK